jgi:hypothetical protein
VSRGRLPLEPLERGVSSASASTAVVSHELLVTVLVLGIFGFAFGLVVSRGAEKKHAGGGVFFLGKIFSDFFDKYVLGVFELHLLRSA